MLTPDSISAWGDCLLMSRRAGSDGFPRIGRILMAALFVGVGEVSDERGQAPRLHRASLIR